MAAQEVLPGEPRGNVRAERLLHRGRPLLRGDRRAHRAPDLRSVIQPKPTPLTLARSKSSSQAS